jgi:hypothetical protein
MGSHADRLKTVTFTGQAIRFANALLHRCRGAAPLAATGLAASGLWELRTGRHQDIAVDVRQAERRLSASEARADRAIGEHAS